MLREELCRRSTGNDWPSDIASGVDVLISMIDRHRPLASDGKHGNLHTATCGCDDEGYRRRTHGPCINNPFRQCGCDDAPCPNCPEDLEKLPQYDRPCEPAGCTKPLSGGGSCWCADNGHRARGENS
jgi:hypothetical protein